MESIASYDRSASALEDPKQFWSEVEELLHSIVVDDEEGGASSVDLIASLTSFYALCDACYDEHLDDHHNADYLLTRLLDSPLIASASVEECAIALSSLAVSATSLPALLLLYETLLKLGDRHSSLFRLCPTSKLLIPRLVHHFWAARYAEEYNHRHGIKNEEASEGHHESDGIAWNVKHVRSASKGNAGKERIDMRNRNVQIRLRELAIILLYEISRSHRLAHQEMRAIDATFIDHLFELVEHSRNWHDDSYNYNLIKLIVSLNEQFMVSGISAASSKPAARKSTASASNTVLTVLRTRLNASKTFGENVIFMLNRASSLDAEDICMQLLILKLLYLLFTTRETAHYFYTNDLKVLVDIFIRELSDLPDDHESLRHTYLRVLHPLLTNTQLLTFPYKRKQIQTLLKGLTSHGHLRDISSTTQRLVDRCLSAEWCVDLEQLTVASSVPSKGNQEDESKGSGARKHTFAVQSIGGGQAKIVEAQAVLDSEGVPIPVGEITSELVRSTSPQSTSSVPASAQKTDSQATVHASSSSRKSLDEDAPSDELYMFRTTRVRSVDGLPSHVHSSLQSLSASTMSDEESRGEKSTVAPTHPRMLEVMGSLDPSSSSKANKHYLQGGSQRNQHDAERAVFAKRVHSALDVSKMHDDDIESSENESEHWIGSPNGSWHQSMTVEPKAVGARRRTGTGSSLVSSPLRDASFQASLDERLSATATLDEKGPGVPYAPAVHVQQPSRDEKQEGQPMSGSGIMRRRPPAPPSARSDSGESRIKSTIQPSPSDPALIPNIALQDVTSDDHEEHLSYNSAQRTLMSVPNGDHLLRVASMPVSPGTMSRNESRSTSPLPDGARTPSSISGRRRRPPPPPVDRSTKVSRSFTPTVIPSINDAKIVPSSTPDTAPTAPPVYEYDAGEGGDGRIAEDQVASVSRMREQQNLSRYMNHLHLSSNNGYGW